MKLVNAMADKNNETCYLETVGTSNISIYKHFGYTETWEHGPYKDEKLFDTKTEDIIEATFVAMKRPPKLKGGSANSIRVAPQPDN